MPYITFLFLLYHYISKSILCYFSYCYFLPADALLIKQIHIKINLFYFSDDIAYNYFLFLPSYIFNFLYFMIYAIFTFMRLTLC